MPVQVSQVKAGNVIGLAVTSAKRTEALPDLPTMVEVGYKDFVVSNYFGLIAPPDTPLAIAKSLRSAVRKAVVDPDVADLFNKQGMAPVANEPAEFGELIKADLERWMRVISDAGIERQ
jgi:tripartite-type tricarboxylate transporter receptor subunit TctC